MSGPLEGVRVLELGTIVAGPFAGRLLGDYGADVIKVEAPGRPDPLRDWGQESYKGHRLWWTIHARNKRCITLDLRSERGQELLRGLVEHADVMVENFRPGTLERWGIGPDRLLAANPRLVIARVTAFGQTGPSSRRPGFGSLAEAMSGFAALTGQPDGPPTLPPFGLADGISALATSTAILTALRPGTATARGR